MRQQRPHDNSLRHATGAVRRAISLSGPRLTRREALTRLGGGALGAAALTIFPLGSPASAGKPAPEIPVAGYRAEVAIEWYRLVLQLVEATPGFSPPVASRAFGYLGVALYEALVPGLSGFHSLAGQLTDLEPLPPPHDPACSWPVVANTVLATSTRAYFPTASDAHQEAINALERQLNALLSDGLPPGIANRSVKRGHQVARHIFDWSMTDGGHAAYVDNFPDSYVPPIGPGLWIPTPPGYLPALNPYWGENRPFVLGSGAAHDPGQPPAFSTDPASQFYAEAWEVFEAVNELTDEQREIARFWADDPGTTPTPPGHSLAILTQLLEEQDANLATAAEAYARAGIAVADAFISCWHCKYRYNLIRPISYLREHIDPTWGDPLPVGTPPFPEYTSGHSVQTGAFAQVMDDLFGDLTFTDHTHDVRGLAPRTFHSWSSLAEEAAISRLYGGIHFRAAIDLGVEQGKAIGRQVSSLNFGSSS